MGLSLLDEFEVQYHVIKSNEFQTYDGAKVKVFARFESESARRRHCLCSRPKFLQARRQRLAQEATMGKVTIFFFFLPSRVFQVYDCYFTNVLTRSSCLGFLLTADSQCFTRNDARTFVPTIPRRRLWPGERSLWVETSRSSFTAEVWSFSPLAPPSLVSSPSKYPPSFVALAFNKTKPAELSPRIAVVTKAIKRRDSSYQLVASGNSHNAVSRHLDKNRAKHIRTVFSMKKAQKSKQRSTNWRRRHLGDMQQQPRRWPGFDKCVETKLRWDVYIRPWPPGWSFWRRIYTSRGSERVKWLIDPLAATLRRMNSQNLVFGFKRKISQ